MYKILIWLGETFWNKTTNISLVILWRLSMINLCCFSPRKARNQVRIIYWTRLVSLLCSFSFVWWAGRRSAKQKRRRLPAGKWLIGIACLFFQGLITSEGQEKWLYNKRHSMVDLKHYFNKLPMYLTSTEWALNIMS